MIPAAGAPGTAGSNYRVAREAADDVAGRPVYEWHITVLRRNHYGTRIDSRTPMVVVAATRNEVTEKVRAAFGATYDGFRKFWSHGWELTEVREVAR